jgi:imidazole glycerol-phosphate synthase subunit HisH
MSKLNIVIIDYGVGNTHSVSNAIQYLGYKKLKIANSEDSIKNADALILPGVGAFEEAIGNLKALNLHHILNEEVLVNKKPILGICVGMQMLANGSEENGWHDGLGWIKGKVVKLNLPKGYAIPHVGWNDVITQGSPASFKRTPDKPNFYFDHSYHFVAENEKAAVQSNNICGVQFHPEKSHTSGLKFFRGFFNSI